MCFAPFSLAKSTGHFSLRSQLLLVSNTWTCCSCGKCHNYRKIERTSFSNKTEPRHTSILTFMLNLNANLPGCWIGRASHNDSPLLPWPPRSPELTSCDISYGVTSRIVESVAAIARHMLQHVWQELDYRIDIYRITKCGHIDHL
jgi:hypothetical protein